MKRFVIKTSIMGILMIILLSIGKFSLAKEFERIQLTYENLVMDQGDTTLMLYTISPAGSDNIENRTWLSHDPEIVEIDENGTITAKKEGTATIELVINGKRETGEDYSETAKCEITVRANQDSDPTFEETKTQVEARTVQSPEVETIRMTTQINQEDSGMSTKTKLIALVTIIGLIVIFILIGTASDKKNGKLQRQGKTEKKEEKGEEERNDKEEK